MLLLNCFLIAICNKFVAIRECLAMSQLRIRLFTEYPMCICIISIKSIEKRLLLYKRLSISDCTAIPLLRITAIIHTHICQSVINYPTKLQKATRNTLRTSCYKIFACVIVLSAKLKNRTLHMMHTRYNTLVVLALVTTRV